MVKAKPSPLTRRRTGFTLIELLIVIAIIAVLASLILAGIQGARKNTYIAGVVTEISQLEAAIASFKSTYGVEPPSSIILCENAGDWATLDPDGRSAAFIRQLWPQYDFANHDINGNGTPTTSTSTDGESFTLTVGECLVFFLGGVNGNVTTGLSNTSVNNNPGNIGPCTGFSKDPSNPFSRGGSREKPSFEFNPARFTDLDKDGFPEYRDNLPSQTKPYLYYSSYDGQGYNESSTAEFDATNANANVLATPYWQGADVSASRWKANSHQIISPGFDGKYGFGGPYVGFSFPTATDSNATGGTKPTDAQRGPEADNITNFSKGVLQP